MEILTVEYDLKFVLYKFPDLEFSQNILYKND